MVRIVGSPVAAIVTLGLLCSSALTEDRAPKQTARARIVESYGQLPLAFEANRGQSDPQVKFLARGEAHALFLTSAEAVVSPAARRSGEASRPVVRMRLVGANSAPRIEGLDPLPGKTNHFTGRDPGQWRIGVPTYGRVQYADVYPGINLVYYGNQRQLEYDFLVAPGADPRLIQFDIRGAGTVRLDAGGDLVLRAAGGEIRQHKPLAFQETGDARRAVEARYILKGKRRVALQVGAYDRGRPLRIDPVLSYSSYLGGDAAITGGNDFGRSIAVDASGNVYVAGSTESPRFPITSNAIRTSPRSPSEISSAAHPLNQGQSALDRRFSSR